MIAITYSGSKSSFWKIVNEDKIVAECTTASINPNFIDQKGVSNLLNKTNALTNHAESIKKIYAFVAGASSKPKQLELTVSLENFFINAKVNVKDDISGAAIAACHNRTGIVGILGSGANCAYFNGKKPEKNNYGLGYILGDEGSSNYLGKMLLKNYLEDKLPEDIRTKVDQKYNFDRAIILDKVYRKANAQAYLSSFLDFFLENQGHKFIEQIIDESFDKYFSTYVIPTIAKHPNEELHFIGLVAGSFEDRLRNIAEKHNVNIVSITKEPIYNLLNYYSN